MRKGTSVAMVLFCLVATLLVCAVSGKAQLAPPSGKGGGVSTRHVAVDQQTPITYHGGPVMARPKRVYEIWYGTWGTSTTASIVAAFVASLSGSSYFNINNTYHDGQGNIVSNAIAVGGTFIDNYSHGRRLADGDVLDIVSRVNPTDVDGIYVVLTSGDVDETSGFGSSYCGWHNHATVNGRDIKYAFVGSPDRYPACIYQSGVSPNGNVMADAMVSVLAHEVNEAATDPDLDAWYDTSGNENADKCAWTYGQTYTTRNGSVANIRLADRDFLIQQNWVNSGAGYCAMSFDSSIPSPPQLLLGGDGKVWAKNTIGDGGWAEEAPPGEIAIAAGSNGLQMLLGGDGKVWAKNTIGNGGWVEEAPPGEIAIAAGSNGLQMLLGGDGKVWAKNTIGYGGWVDETPPGVIAIAAVATDCR
jgi:hypothetical protein